MAGEITSSLKHRLAWIYPDSLSNQLNAAPTLNVTQGLRQLGWNVDLLVGGKERGLLRIQGVDVIGIQRPDLYLIRHVIYHIKVLKYLLDHWNEINVILFRSMSVPWILSLWLKRFLFRQSTPLLVMDTRSLPMGGEKARVKDKLRGKFILLMNALANQFTDGETTITHQMAEALHIPHEKLWGVWPSGVNIDKFQLAIGRRRWPQIEEPIQVIYLGVFSAERNLLNLCRAVDKANQEGMCFELSLVGDGEGRENLIAYASHTGGKISILPRVPHEQVPEVLSKMHVGALPFPDELKFRVSSFIKMFEYMGAGLPVLATRIIAHTDVIDDHACAFWAEESTVEGLTAALSNLWNHRSSLASMGQVASEIAQEYTWTASAKKLDAALQYGLAAKSRIGSK